MKIENVILPNKSPQQRYNVEISQNKIQSLTELNDESSSSSPPSLILPALCHPHIHLDKPYLLTSRPRPSDYPDYSDLTLESGDFAEALSKTSQAKSRYTIPDLILRGSQLIVEGIQAGVTSMRAFAEVDHVTKFQCLDAAVELKKKFSHLCHVQICVFAQDPIMSTEHGEENLKWVTEALDKYKGQIEVLGSTPYVEENTDYGAKNAEWVIKKALEYGLHLDFHLDYTVDMYAEALIWRVIELLKEAKWKEKAGPDKRIVFGHCSRITVFDNETMQKLSESLADLPVAFVGLPTSDLFMIGRPSDEEGQGYGWRSRGTMQVIDMIQKDNLQACIGINNVGNAFTPWGSADPLRLACLGVGVYQAGTPEDAKLLYECVSTRARRAIGLERQESEDKTDDFDLDHTQGGGFLVISNEKSIQCPGMEEAFPARQRLSVTDVVWDPPEVRLRRIVR